MTMDQKHASPAHVLKQNDADGRATENFFCHIFVCLDYLCYVFGWNRIAEKHQRQAYKTTLKMWSPIWRNDLSGQPRWQTPFSHVYSSGGEALATEKILLSMLCNDLQDSWLTESTSKSNKEKIYIFYLIRNFIQK